MAGVQKIKTLLIALVSLLCLALLLLPQEARALTEGLTVTLLRGHTLKDALADARYLTKRGFVKITALTIITEPDAELDEDDFAFIAENLSELTTLDISAAALNANGLPPSALRGCVALQGVKLPSDLASIGSRAFDGCRRLKDIDLPESLKTVGDRAFAGCASLMEIHIPKGVTIIGELAFRGCISLTGVFADAENAGYMSLSGVLYTSDGKELHTYPAGKTGVYSVLAGTKIIPPYAFADCGASLTGITLPEGLETIGEYAFNGCSMLPSVEIPEGVGSIEYAFRGCTSLESVTLPKSLYFIGWETFSNCRSLKEITFAGPIERIGPLAFEKCSSLTDVRFAAYFPTSKISSDAFKGCGKLRTIHVPAGTSANFRPQLRSKIGRAQIAEAA